MLESLGVEKVVSVQYHMNWPSPGNDPWYFNNTVENTARRSYYGVNGIPVGWVDGFSAGNLGSTTAITNQINSRAQLVSPYQIKISGDVGTNSVTVTVKAVNTLPTATQYLRIAIVEKEYHASTPYPNGETHIVWSMLDMLPDGTGTLLNIPAVGDSQTVTFNYNVSQVNFHPPASLENLLTVVAFVQNHSTREVYQTGYAEVGISTGTINAGALIPNTGSAVLSGFAYNKSDSPINVDLGINGNIPSGWNVSAQIVNGASLPVNSGALSLTLQSRDSLYYDITVTPQGNSGGLILSADMNLTSNTSLSSSTNFSVTTNDVDLLVVDDDGGESYESYIIDELNKTSINYGLLSINSGDLSPSDLGTIQTIVWNCALAEPTLDEQDQIALISFLDNGGRLYLNGVDIAYELADPASPYITTNSLEFFNNYLHCDYVQRSPTQLAAQGIAGDPISDGLGVIGLIGGTGASTIGPNHKPNEIVPAAGDPNAAASIALVSAPDKYCGVRASHPGISATGGVLLTTFGFETVSDETKRAILAERILTWLMNPTVIGGEEPLTIANRFELKANYPNPFNPSTTIAYNLPMTERDENVSLIIYNQLGQKVKILVNEIQSAGSHEVVWNGMDDAGNEVASGVYFYQLRYGGYQGTQKMLLVR